MIYFKDFDLQCTSHVLSLALPANCPVTRFFYKNTWCQFQPAVSYFSVHFQPKIFLILFLIFIFEFPEHSSVKTKHVLDKVTKPCSRLISNVALVA